MRRLRDLSFRYKIPLRGSVLVIVTAAAVTTSLIVREYDELKQDLLANSASLGRLLAKTLVTPITHDDLWRAFEIINSPFQTHPQESAQLGVEVVLVLDPRQQVYVSTQPSQYPMLADPARINPDFHALAPALTQYREFETRPVEIPGSDKIYMVTPIVADGVLLGHLVMGYSKGVFVPRFLAIARRAALVTLVVIAFLIPASWFWAQRFAVPMVRLAQSMGRVGARIPDDEEIQVEESSDELGQVGTAFKRMVGELREKESLKRAVMLSERLAAIGRLSAGIAHEINNPLGGMLNAIDTFKHHGKLDPLAARTISLLERGLVQIRDTVAALLVEARVEIHPLTRQDIEDTHTLIQADIQRKRADFAWDNDIVETLPLPSTLVRQILINLMLNAAQAIGERGQMGCQVYRDSTHLYLVVRNDGGYIPPERAEYLFEPFSTGRESGHGLGLWVTYQIVTQLGGEIVVESVPGDTRFAVSLPLPTPCI